MAVLRDNLLAAADRVLGQLSASQVAEVVVFALGFVEHPTCPGTGRCHGAMRGCDRCDAGLHEDADSRITCDEPTCRIHRCRHCGRHPVTWYDEVTHLGDCGCQNPGVCGYCGTLAMRSNGRLCIRCPPDDHDGEPTGELCELCGAWLDSADVLRGRPLCATCTTTSEE